MNKGNRMFWMDKTKTKFSIEVVLGKTNKQNYVNLYVNEKNTCGWSLKQRDGKILLDYQPKDYRKKFPKHLTYVFPWIAKDVFEKIQEKVSSEGYSFQYPSNDGCLYHLPFWQRVNKGYLTLNPDNSWTYSTNSRFKMQFDKYGNLEFGISSAKEVHHCQVILKILLDMEEMKKKLWKIVDNANSGEVEIADQLRFPVKDWNVFLPLLEKVKY